MRRFIIETIVATAKALIRKLTAVPPQGTSDFAFHRQIGAGRAARRIIL